MQSRQFMDKTVHRQGFEDSSPTKFYIVFIFMKLNECPYFDHKMIKSYEGP